MFRQLFDAEEMATLAQEADAARSEIYKGRDGGPRGSWVPLLHPQTPFSASLLEDNRFLSIAQQTFDDRIFGANVDMLYWQGDTGWHRDLDVPGNTGLKLLYYLEPLRAETGALRVVPGSHIEPHEDRVSDTEPFRLQTYVEVMETLRGLDLEPDEGGQSSVVIETTPGDVIAFALPLLHSSFGGAPGRRLGAAIYWMPSPTPEQADARRQEARIIGENHARMFNFPDGVPFCHPDWIAGAKDNPLRASWVEQLRDLEWIPSPLGFATK